MSKSFNDLNLIVFPCADIRNILRKVEFKSFPLVQGKVLRALQFCVCEFEDNCDHTTRFTTQLAAKLSLFCARRSTIDKKKR